MTSAIAGSKTKISAADPPQAPDTQALGSQASAVTSLYILPHRRRSDWIAVSLLMVAACAVFFINLTASGYANEFYSAAAQAASQNWSAFLWGSSDAGNAITVDKPPASIWLMGLSVRLLGLSSFSILLPEALLGIGSTYLLYATVRRYWGNWVGIIAGGIFITTPVTALMFRFNNPDALLVFLMIAASSCLMRSLEYNTSRKGNRRRTWWMVLSGVLVGFGFLTKQFQVLLVLPGMIMAFLVASPTKFIRRLGDGLLALIAMIVSAGWWVILTVLVPADKRPYIGGSQSNSFLELTFSYNGLGRLTGNETGSVVPGGSGAGGSRTGGSQAGMWGQTGWNRLFTSDFAGQITWLAFFAFAGIIVGLIITHREKRTDLRRAHVLMTGTWLLVTWLIFSFMSGIFHAYYTVALSPAISTLAAIAIAGLWMKRKSSWSVLTASALILITGLWSQKIISSAGSYSWLASLTLIVTITGSVLLAITGLLQTHGQASISLRLARILALVISSAAVLVGPLTWTVATVSTGHQGSIVSAGPSSQGGSPMGGGPGGNIGPGGRPGGKGFFNGSSSGESRKQQAYSGQATGGSGLLGGRSNSVSSRLISLLSKNASSYRWAAATTGSQNAATYQLASQKPVMAIGGFNGSDAYPTLAQFKRYVRQGLIHYYISSGSGMGGQQNGGSSTASQIAQWVSTHFTATTVDGVTLYDLTS
ncbi:Predicted membrane protein [Scardovia inopinata]|uniref:Uncharacterized protein n=1 Tax=Scardovia inopinata F0304 TaxID=641146 RepID=W5IK87_SCAIO|nr:glycosyltransferase family 39 protein [Scardovia inopinata]EFG27372.2 hypothetical protein HMPREF9020_01014 [Scardovia inopinata F0304]BAR06984.1 putative glycosyltransferase [Scardovia inopinata JCM 12537]SUV51051.1 Predicted membrane protein [Scardovia inopinata]